MRFEDRNKTLQPPENYTFRNAETDGAYMRLTYFQTIFWTGTRVQRGENVVTIYLNDQGREVGRCIGFVNWPVQPPETVPAPRKYRFRNGWLLVLQGLQEILSCLNK